MKTYRSSGSLPVICFSTDIIGLRQNRLFDAEIAATFPGARWVIELKKLITWPCEFLTSDMALSRVNQGYISARDIFIIQHNFDSECDTLVAAGATLFLLMMFESPLYAPEFYKSVRESARRSNWLMIFEGLAASVDNNIHAYFPSFGLRDLALCSTGIPWGERGNACMVVGNKYVLTQPFSAHGGLEFKLWWLAKAAKKWQSSKTIFVPFDHRDYQLQDKRLQVIEEMLIRGKLDLFGGDGISCTESHLIGREELLVSLMGAV